jgi:hypothetical protein
LSQIPDLGAQIGFIGTNVAVLAICTLGAGFISLLIFDRLHPWQRALPHEHSQAGFSITGSLVQLGCVVLGGLFGGGGSGGGSIDLDASCIMLDANKQMVDAVWFGQLQSKDSSVQHTGDNRTGAGEGDDEVINVNLSRIPDHVQALVFTVNSFTGQTFATVNNAYTDWRRRLKFAYHHQVWAPVSSHPHHGPLQFAVEKSTRHWQIGASKLA